MNYLLLLFSQEYKDKCLTLLKKQFGQDVPKVNVENILENQMMKISWDGLLDPVELAQALTQAVPEIIIETESVSGIESTSRFFNKTQLW